MTGRDWKLPIGGALVVVVVAAAGIWAGLQAQGSTKAAPATTQGALELAVSESDQGKTLKMGDAATVTITLAGNMTTGYSWSVDKVEGTSLEQVGEVQYVPDKVPAGMVGSGGKSVAKFRAVKTGETKITMGYARPWDKTTPAAKTFDVTVVVEKVPKTTPATTKGFEG